MIPGLFQTCANKGFKTESFIAVTDAIVAAAKNLIMDINAIKVRGTLGARDVHPVLNGVKTFPNYIQHVFSVMYDKNEIFKRANYVLMDWSTKW